MTRKATVAVDTLFAAIAKARRRAPWLGGTLTVRKASRPKSLRATWADGTRVDIACHPKGEGESQVVVQHDKLPNARAAERMKRRWSDALGSLKTDLEG